MVDDCANSGRGQEGRIREASPEDADLLLRAIELECEKNQTVFPEADFLSQWQGQRAHPANVRD